MISDFEAARYAHYRETGSEPTAVIVSPDVWDALERDVANTPRMPAGSTAPNVPTTSSRMLCVIDETQPAGTIRFTA